MKKAQFLFILCLCYVIYLPAQAPPSATSPIVLDGEKLEFKVYYKTGLFWFNVGKMQLQASVDDEETILKMTAFTYPKWRKFQNIDIDMLSRSNTAEFYPSSFRRVAYENNVSVFDSVQFHQEELKVDQFLGASRDSMTHFELEIKDKVFDVISFLYSCRYLPYEMMESGEKIPRRLYYNKKAYNLSLDYNGLTEKKVKKLGKYQTHHIQVKTIKSLHFKPTDFMQIWLSTEPDHRPLVFETPMRVGSLRIVAIK